MKQTSLSMIISIATFLVSVTATSQLSKSSETVGSLSTTKGDYYKKNTYPVAISFQTLKNFNKRFTTTDALWYEIEDAYIAKFSTNSVETMVGYGKRGNWLYTIKRYGEKTLPRDVRDQVKSVYFDYTISHIDEVSVPKQENSIYIIQIRDKTNFKTVRVCDREMEIIKEYHE